MSRNDGVRWWEARRAQNRKPATYRCPLCGKHLPALSEHMLLFPEGDHSRRRHAHTACVMKARKEGRLPTRDEWQKRQRDAGRRAGTNSAGSLKPPGRAWLDRLLRRR
jgi:hypothetical protein